MNPIPVYITVRDFGSAAAAMVERLLAVPGCRPIVVDNASTWEPWLAWMDAAPCQVIRNATNRGPRAALEQALNRRWEDDCPYYAISDGDLDLSRVPDDLIAVLRAGLDACPDVGKVGLSIESDDLPLSYPFRDLALRNERQYWTRPRAAAGRIYYEALVDTTFCLLRSGEDYTAYGPALRAGRPYTARHLPWYVTPENMSPEYRHFLSHLDDTHLGAANYTSHAVQEHRRRADAC